MVTVKNLFQISDVLLNFLFIKESWRKGQFPQKNIKQQKTKEME